MRPMTPEDRLTLKALNKAVDDAIEIRTKWLDEKMYEYSEFKIGDQIFDNENRFLGVVTGLYRYQSSQNKLYDTDLDIDYRYKGNNGYEDNTSSQMICFKTKEDVKRSLEWELDALKKMP